MAKVSPVSIKYMIYAKFEAEGSLEKPDVIGAIFGQTEGLLGADLEMRDLQKEGKIGRIEVNLKAENGKTIGEIQIPSALDKTETSLIAAAIETIERIGPSNAKIVIERIDDVRENKRSFILERAKKLLEGMEKKMPRAKEIAANIRTETRAEKIRDYGEEKLPCGNIEGKEIIIVEGRADVLNLLRNGIENVIGMNGTILPETIKELSHEKETTLFVDGDRGGKLIAKNVIENAKIDYIAVAPDGKEVEELSGKEILMALRKKIPANEYLKFEKKEKWKSGEEKLETEKIELEKDKLKEMLEKVKGTKSVLLLDKNLEIVDKVNARAVFSSIRKAKSRIYVIVADTATPNLINVAEENNIKAIVAKNFSAISYKVELISL